MLKGDNKTGIINKGTGFVHTDKVVCAGTWTVDPSDKDTPVECSKVNPVEKNCSPEKTHELLLAVPDITPDEHHVHG